MKMVHFLFLIIVFLSKIVFSQSAKIDTVFLLKDLHDGVYQSIFIDHNRNSNYYEDLNVFDFKESISYQVSLDYLANSNQILIIQQPILYALNWVPLKKFRGAFYVYKPCDFYTNLSFSFNDSTFIDFTGEGAIANKILSQKKIDDKTFSFELTGIYHKNRQLTIYILDDKNEIAMFEFSDYNSPEKESFLMISQNKMKSFPIIVNRCDFHKQHEYFFEEPDYEMMRRKFK
jgi:hypothetical protein